LDGQKRELTPGDLVIADSKNPLAIAGVMGGESTEISEKTENILLESAHFLPTSIRRTSKRLGLVSESSYRFERGVDPGSTLAAANRASYLLQELAEGKVLSGEIDLKKKLKKSTITFYPTELERILGITVASPTKNLRDLGCEVKSNKNYLEVTVPTHRMDLQEEIDLVEEVARLQGYNSIPASLPQGQIPSVKENPDGKIVQECRRLLTRLSLNEVISYTFLSPASVKKALIKLPADIVKMRNPISEEQEILRFSLIPDLLQIAEHNLSRGETSLKFFQLNQVYQGKKKEGPRESLSLGILLSGDWEAKNWLQETGEVSFYHLKGILENLLRELSSSDFLLQEAKHPTFQEDSTFAIVVKGEKIGLLGEVKPSVRENFSLEKATYLAEINMELLLPQLILDKRFTPLPKYPPVARDISLLVPTGITSSQVESLMKECGQSLLERIELFDKYEGKQIPKEHQSLSYSLYYRSTKGTLTDDSVNKIQDEIIKTLVSKLNVRLR